MRRVFALLIRYRLALSALVILGGLALWLLGPLNPNTAPIARGAGCGHTCGNSVQGACGGPGGGGPYDNNCCGCGGVPLCSAQCSGCGGGNDCYYCCEGCAPPPGAPPGANGCWSPPSDPSVELSLSKTNGVTSVVPGAIVQYTLDAANNSDNEGQGLVVDNVPAALTSVTWTCASLSGGGACSAGSGAGSLNTVVTLPPHSAVRFTLRGTLNAGATGSLQNTASIQPSDGKTDSNPGNNTAADTDAITPQANLAVTKSNGAGTVVPGAPVAYTIVASNAGPSNASGAVVQDTFPALLTSVTWTCAAAGGAACGQPAGSGHLNTTVTLPAGGTTTFTASGVLASAASGSLSNTAIVSPPAGVTDPNAGNNSATDTDAITPQADLAIAISDGVTTEIPGTSIAYTIIATNAGPSAVSGATVSAALPASLTGGTWACSASAGSACGQASGSGDVNATVALAPGGTATFTLNATIQPAATGNVATTATVGAPAGYTDPNGVNNTATDSDALTPQADLSITKTDGAAAEVPGTAVVYTVVATNAGPSTAANAVVQDALSAAISGATWTCSATAGSACGQASGSGSISQYVTLAPGGSATYTVTGAIQASATGSLANSATVSAPAGTTDPNPGGNTATDMDTLTPQADLQISKRAHAETAAPGTLITYTITVTNTGPSDAPGTLVTDTVPAALSSVAWTCGTTAGSACSQASGSGSIATAINLASGGVATFTLRGLVSPSASGTLTNTATVSPGDGVVDPDPTGNGGTDDTPLVPMADLSITKSDGVTAVTPGEPITYTITVANAGPSAASGTVVSDVVPAVIASPIWTCQASAGSTCAQASGSGDLLATVDLAPGGSVTFTLAGTIQADAHLGAAGGAAGIVNAVYLIPATGVTNTGDDTATDSNTLAPRSELRLSQHANPAAALPGDDLQYTTIITNTGPSDEASVPLVVTLPRNTTYVSATWTQGTCAYSGSALTCALGRMDAGQRASVVLTVRASVAGQYTSTAQSGLEMAQSSAAVNAWPTPTQRLPGVPNPTVTATATATPTSSAAPTPTGTPQPAEPGPTLADVVIAKTASVQFAAPGDLVTYTLTAQNPNAAGVDGVVIVDPLPIQLEYVSAAVSIGSANYDAASHTLTAPVGHLDAHQTVRVTVVGRIQLDTPIPSDVYNVARVTGSGVTPRTSATSTVHVGPKQLPKTGGDTAWILGVAVVALVVLAATARDRRWLALVTLMALTACLPSSQGGESPARLAPSPTVSDPASIATQLPQNVAWATATPLTWWHGVATELAATPFPTPQATPWGVAPLAIPDGQAHLTIPKIQVDAPIVSVPLKDGEWDIARLADQIGWLVTTGSSPTDRYGMAFAGHVSLAPDRRPGPLARLAELQPGDEIRVWWTGQAGRGEYVYRVTGSDTLSPEAGTAVYGPAGTLAVVTCADWDAARRTYQTRLIVKAAFVKAAGR